jgi:hypothetical protein
MNAITASAAIAVIVLSACASPGPQTEKAPACADCNANSLPAGTTTTGSRCIAPASCINTNGGLLEKLADAKCKTINGTSCTVGECPLGSQNCRGQYSAKFSSGLSLANCVAKADPACAGGEQLCTCDIVVANPGVLACNCGCE